MAVESTLREWSPADLVFVGRLLREILDGDDDHDDDVRDAELCIVVISSRTSSSLCFRKETARCGYLPVFYPGPQSRQPEENGVDG